MPEVDIAMLADYVRTDPATNIAHLVAGGIDTIYAREIPAARNIGLLLRIEFERVECGRGHIVEVLFQDEDGERIMHLTGRATPQWNDEWPPTWKAKSMLAFNFGVPLPREGLYDFQIVINDSYKKTLPIRVVQVSEPTDTNDEGDEDES